jgi:hypothetical protein
VLLGVARSKAKMYEYHVPQEHHIDIKRDPARLFALTIGLLGDYSARFNSGDTTSKEYEESRTHLRFAAQFFDAYRDGKFDVGSEPYILLVGSAAYYLSDLPGSATVLAKRLPSEMPDLGAAGLEDLIHWLLRPERRFQPTVHSRYPKTAARIVSWFDEYRRTGADEDGLLPLLRRLRNRAYSTGSARELLFADIACALAHKRLLNSARFSLPKYSELPASGWSDAFNRPAFIKELWPAQHLLGEAGVFAGKSAVVQMPTSAGKTRGVELIIRSAFLSGRASLAIIVAPFRALCHEIRRTLIAAFSGEAIKVDELTDVAQEDFDVDAILNGLQVVVVTPEKLLYVIRHAPELAESIGLIVYDEGHQFDNGSRGVTYELLLTSLKSRVPKTVQTILISAVISNPDVVKEWLMSEDAVVVSGENTSPTYRSTAFASWTDRLGRLWFVDQRNPEVNEFYVPRLIEELPLSAKRNETSVRVFPERQGSDVALYLGLKLVESGSVAVFCGRKDSATAACETIVDIFDRGVQLGSPLACSNADEIERLVHLHTLNLGGGAIATQAAQHGVFSHHGNTPHGIRLSVEHALKESHACFVVCTSTLAQGVNLPIRYLIVTSTQQGVDRIKTRDFHNLIGRAGRAGMYTEGTVLFANAEVFDKRGGRWSQVKSLLNPRNAEPCDSILISIFDPFISDDGKTKMDMRPMRFVTDFIADQSELLNRPTRLAEQYASRGFTPARLMAQVKLKVSIISGVESYLMAHWDSDEMDDESVSELARGTLAFHLATEEEQLLLIQLFVLLAENIRRKIPEPESRHVFGKLLYGVSEVVRVREWVERHVEDVEACSAVEEILPCIWPLLAELIENPNFKKARPIPAMYEVAVRWISGAPFYELLAILFAAGVRFGEGKGSRKPKIEYAVELGEDALGYDGMLAVGAIAEVYRMIRPDDEVRYQLLLELQRRMKYGLSSNTAILAYELGFADREVAKIVSAAVNGVVSKDHLLRQIRSRAVEIRELLMAFPEYFTTVLDCLVGKRAKA